jgi:hypothetical protein
VHAPGVRFRSFPSGKPAYWDLEVPLEAYVNVPPMSKPAEDIRFSSGSWKGKPFKKLLRKEVIQPHLPVRLPCYDLVLITDPTFDGSLHKGWATGFGCYRLS